MLIVSTVRLDVCVSITLNHLDTLYRLYQCVVESICNSDNAYGYPQLFIKVLCNWAFFLCN